MERRFVAYRLLLGFTCQAPIFALFYLSNGLDYRAVMLLALAFAVAKICCDVPSGMFADRFGRRAAILTRVGLECVSVALMFDQRFTAASLVAGAACAFSAGAEQALVYECAPRDFARIFGRAASWGFVSTAAAALAGGALALASFELVYLLRLGVLAAAGCVCAGFPEPARPRTPVRLGAALGSGGPGLHRALAFIGIVGAVHVAALQLQQPFLRSAGVPLALFGALYVAFQVATAAGARLAHRLSSPMGFIVAASIGGFALMALPIGAGGVAAVFLLKLAHGVSLPAIGRALNERAAPGARATSLSLRSLFEGAALAIAAPALGWTADMVSLGAAFAAAALLLLPALMFMEASCVASDGSRSPA